MSTFAENLTKSYEEMAHSPFLFLRALAWERFQQLGLPHNRTETYRYFPLLQLYAQSFAAASCPALSFDQLTPWLLKESEGSLLVFVNGYFDPTLSRLKDLPDSLIIVPLNQAFSAYGALLNNYFSKSLKEETDPFACLNAALHPEGLFLYCPPKTVVKTPIHLLNIVSSPQKALLSPRLFAFIGRESQVDFISTAGVLEPTCEYFLNLVHDLSIEEGARVTYTHTPQPSPSSWQLEALRATLKRDAYLQTFLATTGAKTTRQDYDIQLTGENGEAILNGLWVLKEQAQSHTHAYVNHLAPHCHSTQLFKGILFDAARSSFEGKIYVHPEAQKTDAYQRNNNLLLGSQAMANSKPNLEIFADDVKASHGATFGQLDKEALFYLKTRGLSDDEAKRLLVNGFSKEVIELIPHPTIVKRALEWI